MLVLLLLVLTSVDWAHQHLSYPINFCTLAAACVHDNRMVCASSPDGCSRRSFLDQCDMYEYNCDFNTQYQETYTLYCLSTDLEILFPEYNPTTSRTTFTYTNCGTSLTTTVHSVPTRASSSTVPTTAQLITTTTSTAVTEPSTSFTGCCDRPKTWETTTQGEELLKWSVAPWITSTPMSWFTMPTMPSTATTSRPTSTAHKYTTIPNKTTSISGLSLHTENLSNYDYNNYPTTSTTIHTTTKSRPSTSYTPARISQPSTITPFSTTFNEYTLNKTEEIFTPCCYRPKTWETTESITTILLTDDSIENIISTTEDLLTTEEIPSTIKQNTAVSSTTILPITTKSSTITDESSITTTESPTSTEAKATTQPTTTTKSTTSVKQTTTEFTSTTQLTTTKITPTSTLSKQTQPPSILSRSTTTPPKMSHQTKSPTALTTALIKPKITPKTSSIETSMVYSIKTTFLTETPQALKVISKIVPLPAEFEKLKQSGWFYPAVCKSKKCEAPVTWIKTTRRRRQNRNYGYHY